MKSAAEQSPGLGSSRAAAGGRTPHALVLFDIDGTLVTTGGAGMAAMVHAGRELFGEGFTAEGIDFAGRLDPLIMPDMLRKIGLTPTRENLAAFREAYSKRLPIELNARAERARALPGVHGVLAELYKTEGVALGLVTGNFATTGSMKLATCGIDHTRFVHNGWGDADGHGIEGERAPTRDALPRHAIGHFEGVYGVRPEGRRVVVIGDTPHDVRCGKVNGCRTLAVATGKSSVEQLAASGADLALADLSDVSRVAEFLLA